MRALALMIVTLGQSPTLPSQPASVIRSFGDRSVQSQVEARTRAIYEAASKPESVRSYMLIAANPLSVPDAVSTDATGTFVAGVLERIVANVATRQGKYAVEFYIADGRLTFTYETFVYVEESAPAGAWRNFMGLAAWERRTYFDAQGLAAFAESTGPNAPDPGADGTRLHDQMRQVAGLLEARALKGAR